MTLLMYDIMNSYKNAPGFIHKHIAMAKVIYRGGGGRAQGADPALPQRGSDSAVIATFSSGLRPPLLGRAISDPQVGFSRVSGCLGFQFLGFCIASQMPPWPRHLRPPGGVF